MLPTKTDRVSKRKTFRFCCNTEPAVLPVKQIHRVLPQDPLSPLNSARYFREGKSVLRTNLQKGVAEPSSQDCWDAAGLCGMWEEEEMETVLVFYIMDRN